MRRIHSLPIAPDFTATWTSQGIQRIARSLRETNAPHGRMRVHEKGAFRHCEQLPKTLACSRVSKVHQSCASALLDVVRSFASAVLDREHSARHYVSLPVKAWRRRHHASLLEEGPAAAAPNQLRTATCCEHLDTKRSTSVAALVTTMASSIDPSTVKEQFRGTRLRYGPCWLWLVRPSEYLNFREQCACTRSYKRNPWFFDYDAHIKYTRRVAKHRARRLSWPSRCTSALFTGLRPARHVYAYFMVWVCFVAAATRRVASCNNSVSTFSTGRWM